MRIKWGFLNRLAVLTVMAIAAPQVHAQESAAESPTPPAAKNQTPLPAQPSMGWGQSSPASGTRFANQMVAPATWPPPGMAPSGMGMPPGGMGMPPGMMGGFHGGPMIQASFEGDLQSPQPFPGPVPTPMAMEGPDEYMEAPYPAPFDGIIGDPGCPYCSGAGCESCGVGSGAGGLIGWVLNGMAPYREGGICAPRWYDITLDAMFLSRDDTGRRVPIASEGINGNIVLSTDDLGFQEEVGFRFTGATQVSVGLIAEFTYFGLFNWADQAREERAVGDLFSVYTDFGTNPFNGTDQTDFSTFQEITYSSRIDNFELNFRRRWSAPNCTYQGSWLAGVRYIYLLEDFEYNSSGGDDLATPAVELGGRQETDVSTRNSMTGFQIGADLWTPIVPGITVGGEVKAGVFGNYANQQTQVLTVAPIPVGETRLFEEASINDIAFAGEARLEAIYRTGPNWTLRAGYTFFVLDGVALASENLNQAAPPNLTGVGVIPRQAAKNDNGSAFYHGGHFGLEYVW